MAAFGNEPLPHPTQAPSGSRLAQYLNGRPAPSNHLGGQQRFSPAGLLSSNGYSEDAYGMSYGGAGGADYQSSYGSPATAQSLDPSSTLGKHQSEILALSQNVPPPLVDLQLTTPETLKQRWALSANATYFVDADLRTRLLQRQLAQTCFPSPPALQSVVDTPEVAEHFRNLQAIGQTPMRRLGSGSQQIEHTYKAVSSVDGVTYALHRITNTRPLSSYATNQLENWRRVAHSNIARLHSVLPTNAFKDSSHLFVYDFQPLAEPIGKHFFHGNGTMKPKFLSSAGGLNEQLLWNFIIQISGAIRHMHAMQMALRCLDLNRILVNSSGRFIISGVGILDAFADSVPNLVALQTEDLRMFGAVLVSLVNGVVQHQTPQENIDHVVQQIDRHYSSDLRNVVKTLCRSHPSGQDGRATTTINDIMPMIGARFYSQVEAQQVRIDMLENDLCKELQNGRLFRLLGMLCTVCDRNLPKEPYWSETSECYMLKLFRDYVFHQVDAFGRPVLDLAHIVLNLNKLDAGLDEPIQLASRDSETILLVTYKDLRSYLESSFAYLRKEMESDLGEELKITGQQAIMQSGAATGAPMLGATGGYPSASYRQPPPPSAAEIGGSSLMH